ncbi:DUF4328 domain-containing protein [Microbacterium sp. LjRoot45]|uniref:DUF4328 domain-containing protein n=1 Tax=Microbacterium sp. LjRoot45 TaxID=3342329 RepID=UPI003ECEFD9A
MLVRPVRGIAAAVRWLVAAAGALALAAAGIEIFGLVSIDAFANGTGDVEALYLYDGVSVVVAVLGAAALLAAAVCWFVWQYRAADLATAAGVPPRRAPVWHVVSWFIPVVLLWFPFQNVKDLARSSRAALSGALLGAWWALWLVGTTVSRVSAQLVSLVDTLPQLSAVIGVSLFSHVLLAAAAPLAWLIVARITDGLQPARS